MKRYLTPTLYEVHAQSPRTGFDCLLGGSTNLADANRIAKRQAKQLFESPWEAVEDKFKFLESIYVLNTESEHSDCMSYETEEYIDNLMSQLDSPIAKKSKISY